MSIISFIAIQNDLYGEAPYQWDWPDDSVAIGRYHIIKKYDR